MTVDPHSFTIIVQAQQAGSPMVTCRGFPQLAAVQPTRVLVVADGAAVAWRDDLVDVLATQFGLLAAGAQDCYGPGGFKCWATHEPGVRNLLVVVASDQAPSAELSQLAGAWLSQGFETLGVFRAGLNPDEVPAHGGSDPAEGCHLHQPGAAGHAGPGRATGSPGEDLRVP